MTGFCICVGFKICKGSEYSRIVNVPGFWIPRFTEGLPGLPTWQVVAYARIIQGSEYAWIWLNNTWINYSDYSSVLNMSWRSLTGFWIYHSSKFGRPCLKFKGSCLKQKNATYTPPNRIIFFIVYELDS